MGWGDIPGWIALLIALGHATSSLYSWRKRCKEQAKKREAERKDRTLTELDLRLLRAAEKRGGLISTHSDRSRGQFVVTKGEAGEDLVFADDTSPEFQAKCVSAIERMLRLKCFDQFGGCSAGDGRIRHFQLTDLAYRLLSVPVVSGEVVVPGRGEA